MKKEESGTPELLQLLAHPYKSTGVQIRPTKVPLFIEIVTPTALIRHPHSTWSTPEIQQLLLQVSADLHRLLEKQIS
jgi:hypothetical protein